MGFRLGARAHQALFLPFLQQLVERLISRGNDSLVSRENSFSTQRGEAEK